MTFKNVTIAGTGVLGSQIAYQTALNGFKVTAYDIHPDNAKRRVLSLKDSYKSDIGLTDEEFDAALNNLIFTDNLSQAVKNADYIIEALPEKLDLKANFYQQISKIAPESTIFASNSSTMVPSQLIKYVDRPTKFMRA